MQADERLLIVLTGTQHVGVEFSMEAAAALASLRLAKGHVDDALEITNDPIDIAAAKEIWLWATDLVPIRVDALIAAGRVGEAAGLVTEFARGLHGRETPAPRAALKLCRAILAEARGEHASAAGLFARAAADWQALPRPYDVLLARERQGRCLLAAGRAEPGLALLTEVQAGLSGLGATGDADRVAHSLRGHGEAVPRVWRGGRHGYGDRLSPRELDVARLAAAGHTNKEIAAVLYRSPHTVGHQLRSAMRKLGVSSRAALAAVPAMTGTPHDGRPDGGLPEPSQTAGGR